MKSTYESQSYSQQRESSTKEWTTTVDDVWAVRSGGTVNKFVICVACARMRRWRCFPLCTALAIESRSPPSGNQ
eukprot:2855717-Amphidinium_carterae.1